MSANYLASLGPSGEGEPIVPVTPTPPTPTPPKKKSLLEPFGTGIARDYKARLPLYASDIKDGLNTQCLAATLFLFFACLAPAVGFGGLFAGEN